MDRGKCDQRLKKEGKWSMAPKRLTETEKREILDLYRLPEESTSTLASRFGVSNSTINRILKQGIPAEEYEALVQQKRSGPKVDAAPPAKVAKPIISKRKAKEEASADQLPIFDYDESDQDDLDAARAIAPKPKSKANDKRELDRHVLEEIEEDVLDVEHRYSELDALADEDEDDLDALDDDLDEDLEDEDLDDDDLDDEGLDDAEDFALPGLSRQTRIEILPLETAKLPRTCYVVVDRSSELITRPLKEFAELGLIPDAEIQAKTLPIFDNHRVARRFSRRMQRVVKVPDSRMFSKASEALQAKGITRLLVDGQVYSL
jgi:transposase-like protein